MGRRKQIDQTYLVSLAERLGRAPHSEKSALIDAAASALGISRNAVYSQLKTVGWSSGRKTRADSGKGKVTPDEARIVAAIMKNSSRATGKQLLGVETAMDIARANGRLITDCSPSTMLRALEQYGLHPNQLSQPSPHTPMRSEHPNHVWEFDVSVCVLYYLDDGGLSVMDKEKFYKNKPVAESRVVNKRVQRYLAVDHYTGAFYVRYFNRAGEDKETIYEFLVDAFLGQDHPQAPFRGVPKMLVWDAGSANQSKMVKDFLDRLTVDHWAHTPGNPRAKGQVERTHDIVERDFEGRLHMMHVTDMDQLNEAAWTWMRWYNARKQHSRHGKTRYGLWQTISQDQLRLCPPREICGQLLRDGFEERRVRPNLMISYALKGQPSIFYSVRRVPGIMVGDKVRVCVNPYRYPNVDVLVFGADGTETAYELVPEERNEAGFFIDAPVFGENYKAQPATLAEDNRRNLLQDAYGVSTQQEADKKRVKREPAFRGEIDPVSYLASETVAYFMERPGQALEVPGQFHVECQPLSLIEAMKRLAAMRGRPLTQDQNQRIRARYPDGVAESALEEVMSWLAQDGQPETSKIAIHN